MKKTLIALAALAATGAFAQSTVSITGVLDMGMQTANIKNNAVNTSAAANGSATSGIFIGGTEDLGGGMKAFFQWELDPVLDQTSSKTAGTSATGTTSNDTSSIGNGQSYLGLSGSYGSIKLGTPNSATLGINGMNGFATAVGSGYRVASFDAVRFQNTLKLESNQYGGFSGSFLWGAKNDAQTAGSYTGNLQNQVYGRDGVMELGLNYANGPLALAYAHLEVSQDAGSSNGVTTFPATAAFAGRNNQGTFKLDTAAVNYTMGALKLGAFWQLANSANLWRVSSATTAVTVGSQPLDYNRTTFGLNAAYDVTPALNIKANVMQVSVGSENNTAATSGNKTNVYGLGADYALSKRTSLYARWELDQDDAGVRAITGYTAVNSSVTYSVMALGVRHSF
jgi:predicted porin